MELCWWKGKETGMTAKGDAVMSHMTKQKSKMAH